MLSSNPKWDWEDCQLGSAPKQQGLFGASFFLVLIAKKAIKAFAGNRLATPVKSLGV